MPAGFEEILEVQVLGYSRKTDVASRRRPAACARSRVGRLFQGIGRRSFGSCAPGSAQHFAVRTMLLPILVPA